MVRGRRRFLGGIAAIALAFLALPAGAVGAISTDPAITILYVKGDAEANQIVVECTGKVIAVNGVPAEEGTVSCRDLKKLHVYGFGGDDTIVLGGFPQFEEEGPDLFSFEFDDYEEERSILVSGGDGNDTITADASDALVSGDAGNDLLRGGNAIASLAFGGPGDDHLVGGRGFSLMISGPGNDVMEGSLAITSAAGGPGADVFEGRGGLDFVFGGAGSDRLLGNGSTDLLLGAAGRDSLFGGAGSDLLVGGDGRDRLRGGPGHDGQFQDSAPRGGLLAFLKQIVLGEPSLVAVSGRLRQLAR